MRTREGGRLVVVSHRLPAALRRDGDAVHVEASSGGLVTALAPVLRRLEGTWIGCPGLTTEECDSVDLEAAMRRIEAGCDCRCRGVLYGERDRDDFYRGFSNEIVWPLFHDLLTRCRFEPRYWTAYERVNRQFADVVRPAAGGATVWVHDYHLMRVATELRRHPIDATLAFFLHIPFPAPDMLARLPWRREVLVSLADFDVCGFQTTHDLDNFLCAVEAYLPEVRVERDGSTARLLHGTRSTRLGAFPIGIDVEAFETTARSARVRARAREISALHGGAKLMLGVDRLDYTKGIPERIRAFDRLLETRPDLHGGVVFHQQLVPSREAIAEYASLRSEIDELVGKINGRYTVPGWTPVTYSYGAVGREELVAMYRAADVALVTSLRDGMNLVSLEFCASRVDEGGVLVLSEFAGSSEALGPDAILVNPFDGDRMCAALSQALQLSSGVARERMRRLRAIVEARNAQAWAGSFLATVRATTRGLRAFRPVGPA